MPSVKQKKATTSAGHATGLNSGNAALNNMYPSYGAVDGREAISVVLPTSAGSYFHLDRHRHCDAQDENPRIGVSIEEARITHQLPLERTARYSIYEIMGADPTIDSAIKMHIANALSSKADNEEVVRFEALDHEKNAYVDDLQTVFSKTIRRDIEEWAYKAALYGACYVRVYGEAGKGITNIRCDYHTLPAFIKKYEKGGRNAGFTAAFQGAAPQSRQIQIMEPWKIVGFEVPAWSSGKKEQPMTYGPKPVDLSIDNFEEESLIESQEYGASLLQTAYQPWRDLLDAINSLKMSRHNAARLERLISVHTGKLDPDKAANYVRLIAEGIKNTSADMSKRSSGNGYEQTVVNHIMPVFGEKGGVDINTVQGTPDIVGLEDVLFHVKRLGSAVGIDPSLLGFGDFLSGGLGDGGFFRVSIMAAIKANVLRRAIANGLQRLAEIHIAYKYNKVFAPQTCPWKITFNSVSTAIERELQEAIESRANIAGAIVGIIATMDQEFTTADKREFTRYIWCDILKFDEPSFERSFPKGKELEGDEINDADGVAGEDDYTEKGEEV